MHFFHCAFGRFIENKDAIWWWVNKFWGVQTFHADISFPSKPCIDVKNNLGFQIKIKPKLLLLKIVPIHCSFVQMRFPGYFLNKLHFQSKANWKIFQCKCFFLHEIDRVALIQIFLTYLIFFVHQRTLLSTKTCVPCPTNVFFPHKSEVVASCEHHRCQLLDLHPYCKMPDVAYIPHGDLEECNGMKASCWDNCHFHRKSHIRSIQMMSADHWAPDGISLELAIIGSGGR